MAGISAAALLPGLPVRVSSRTISTLGGASKVTGWDNQPAAGRPVVLLGRDYLGAWVVVAQTLTDANGDYEFALPAGANDRFVVVVAGDPAHHEYTRALGDLQAVA